VNVAAELDPAPTTGDKALLQRLVANLVDNAVQHNEIGGQVGIRTGTDAAGSLLEITNGGPVVAVEDLERLFEPFERLGGDRSAHDDGHHGLGLSIVRAIATAHGGTVTARSQPGGGLTVLVTLPGPDGASGSHSV